MTQAPSSRAESQVPSIAGEIEKGIRGNLGGEDWEKLLLICRSTQRNRWVAKKCTGESGKRVRVSVARSGGRSSERGQRRRSEVQYSSLEVKEFFMSDSCIGIGEDVWLSGFICAAAAVLCTYEVHMAWFELNFILASPRRVEM
jgi:hypothetical protein